MDNNEPSNTNRAPQIGFKIVGDRRKMGVGFQVRQGQLHAIYQQTVCEGAEEVLLLATGYTTANSLTEERKYISILVKNDNQEEVDLTEE